MPRLLRNTPWGRIVWMVQIVMSSLQELEAHERKQAREIARRVYHDRRLDARDRERLLALARKASRGAIRGARGGGIPRFGGRRR